MGAIRDENNVVIWRDGHQRLPLRQFKTPGMAWEFMHWVNNTLCLRDNYMTRIKAFAQSYKPNDVYLYPEYRGDNVKLTKVRV